MDNILQNLVRVGIVQDLDRSRPRCRVKYPDTGIISGWLYVLQRGTSWTPRINEKVLVLYVPAENGDGFVLGGIN